MSRLIWGLNGVALLALAGCNPPHPRAHAEAPLRAISALDCPAEQGDLSLKSAAGDGQSCLYQTDGGGQVTLQLIKYDGDPQAALAPIEARLKAELPPDNDAPPQTPTPGKDAVDINLPGIHIHANDHDKHDDADIQVGGGDGVGGVSVHAHDNTARVEVDARGAGIHRNFVMTTDHPGPHGYKVVGYEAVGPTGGPLAVASVLTKDDDSLRDDVHALLRHNVGG